MYAELPQTVPASNIELATMKNIEMAQTRASFRHLKVLVEFVFEQIQILLANGRFPIVHLSDFVIEGFMKG
jgi:hypothetical protein